MKLKADKTTYNISLEEMRALLAAQLEVEPEKVQVRYVLGKVGADRMDRYPGRDEVVRVEVTVDNA